MGTRRLVQLALGLAIAGAGARSARADGACVAIDTTRDNLMEDERFAVRVAAATALESEGVVVDHTGTRCTGHVTLYNVRLGKRIKTTIITGPNTVTGEASSINELDLLIRQLMRSLVTGRMFATGTGVQDRENVLRDQTAPRRINPADRLWYPMIALGGGMLQLPATESRPMQRQYSIVSMDARFWGFITDSPNGIEFRARMLLHDYSAVTTAGSNFKDSTDGDKQIDADETGWAFATMFSPLAVPNWDFGFGFVRKLGELPPHPYVRVGVDLSLMCRFTDPDHRFDVGPGFYAGFGFILGDHVSLAVEANIARPMIHSAYDYFLTTTANLEFRSEPEFGGPFKGQETPTIRRINE